MNPNLLAGELVRLAAPDPETQPEIAEKWHRDSEFLNLGYGSLATPWSVAHIRRRIERYGAEEGGSAFAIYTRADDRLIGQLGLWTEGQHGDAWVWILIGDRNYWGKGYGTDAMRVLIRYAFDELNLRRLTLRVFSFNTRAIRSYEKLGFVHEGNERLSLNRLGQRWDDVWMGLLRSDWQAHEERQS